MLRPKGACVTPAASVGIFSVQHAPAVAAALVRMSCPQWGFLPGASVAKLNIDSVLMAQQTVLPTRTYNLEDVLFALRGGVFRCWLSFPSDWQLAACCSPFLTFLLFPFSLPSLQWHMGCVLALPSYRRHAWRTPPSLILQSNLSMSTASPQNFYTQTVRCLQCRSLGKYFSKIEAVGTSPACVYVWIAKYVPLNKFRIIFCLIFCFQGSFTFLSAFYHKEK